MEKGATTAWLALFATAMGLLEAAVVIYLRELYYPDGFRFPLAPLPARIWAVEVLREAATIAMLLAVAVLCTRDRLDRFFVFGFIFGVWDIVYYAGLLAILGWPPSPLTWDVLFLIPLPWLGPVACPVVISALLIGAFALHGRLRRRGGSLCPRRAEWVVAVAGATLVVVSFCWNWRAVVESTVPERFPLALFLAGALLGSAPFARAAWRARAESAR
jgi:hypothetical protein